MTQRRGSRRIGQEARTQKPAGFDPRTASHPRPFEVDLLVFVLPSAAHSLQRLQQLLALS